MQKKIVGKIAVATVMLGILVGCGGGGDAPATTPVVATTAQSAAGSPAAPSSAAASSPSGTPSNCGFGSFEAELLERLNAERARGADCRSKGVYGAAGAVVWNVRIEAAALGHSQDMMSNNFFSHIGHDGRTLSQRVDATGYAWSRLGENIAAGYPDVAAVVAAWMASDGHCVNMMDPRLAEVGMSCVARQGSATYSNYWTLDFGTPR